MCLCDNCSRSMFNNTCSIPTENDMYMWKNHREVINDDGTCDYYKKERVIEKIKDFFLTPYYRASRKIEAVCDFFKFNVVNRMKYKFDIRDTWNLSTSISEFIVPRLKYFIKNKPMGTPGQLVNRKFVEDNNLTQYFSGELNDEWFDPNGDNTETYDAWIKILSAMLKTFEYNSDSFSEEYNVMVTNDYGELELDHELLKQRNDMNAEGLRLFSIFFENLWD